MKHFKIHLLMLLLCIGFAATAQIKTTSKKSPPAITQSQPGEYRICGNWGEPFWAGTTQIKCRTCYVAVAGGGSWTEEQCVPVSGPPYNNNGEGPQSFLLIKDATLLATTSNDLEKYQPIRNPELRPVKDEFGNVMYYEEWDEIPATSTSPSFKAPTGRCRSVSDPNMYWNCGTGGPVE